MGQVKEVHLVIDVGNTRTKYAFFEDTELKDVSYETTGLFEDIGKWKEAGTRIHVLFSGSGKLPEGTRLLLNELADEAIEASPFMPLPLKIGYDTPGTLGFDRIAICVGAMSLIPGTPLLVIDSGTAVTFNYVSAEGVFLGGNISPGLEMRFRSLHQFTARLPEVKPAEDYGGMGTTTEQAIRNGVMNGMLFEAEYYIRNFIAENTRGKVVITGGNSHFWKNRLNLPVLFSPYLGFIGLNSILIFSKKVN